MSSNGQQRVFRGYVVIRPGGVIETHTFSTDKKLATDTFCRDEARRLNEGGVKDWKWYEHHEFTVHLAELRV